MIRFQADADLNQAIITGVLRLEPAIDFRTARDRELDGVPDLEVLELAANDERILVTHDRRTMPQHFETFLKAGKSSPGVLIVSRTASLDLVVRTIVLIWAASDIEDWRDHVHYLPSLARHVFRS